MWRKLTMDERTMLLANYRFGAYLLRFVMSLWLIFITLYGMEGVKQLLSALGNSDYAGTMGALLGLFVVGLFIYVPCHLIRTIGTEEIKALKGEETMIAEGLFISSERVSGGIRRSYYRARVRILDRYGNEGQITECRSVGNLSDTCREGDRVSVLMPNPDRPEELVCFRLKM